MSFGSNANPSFTYTNSGSYTPQLRVYDSAGNMSVANFTVTVGNNRPIAWLTHPPNGAIYDWGDEIDFAAGAFDVEDGSTTNGTIPCTNLLVELDVGHNDHSHGIDFRVS